MVTDPAPARNGTGNAGGPAPESAALLARLGDEVSLWDLEVTATLALTPTMRRIRVTAPGLGAFSYRPGQDLMLSVPATDGATFRRRYTVRSFDPAAPALDIDVVLHGDGPAATWAAGVQPGDRIEAIGPRGKGTVDPGAQWHLFAGDDSAVPASLAMAETLPADRLVVVLEVDGAHDEQQATAVDGRCCTAQLTLSDELAFVVIVPDRTLNTAESRAVLPRTVSRADVVFNLGRMGLLLAGLADPSVLTPAATADRIHQRARAALFPQAPALLDALVAAGALASCWSGAGPSLLAIAADAASEKVRAGAQAALDDSGLSGRVMVRHADRRGLVMGDAAELPVAKAPHN